MSQHKSFLVLPDDQLQGTGNIESTTSTGGRHPGRGNPDASNEGNLSALVGGQAETDESDYDFRIQTSGGLVEGATYAWKRPTEDDTGWRGSNDQRFFHAIDDPFQGNLSSSSPLTIHRVAYAYSPKLDTEFFYRPLNSTQLQIKYRRVDETEKTWNTATATLGEGTITSIDYHSAKTCQIAIDILDDGSFRLVVFLDADLDVYESDDGLTFKMAANNIATRFLGRNVSSAQALQIDESGGYLQIIFQESIKIYSLITDPKTGSTTGGTALSSGFRLTTLVSSDRGATWRPIDDQVIDSENWLAQFGPTGTNRWSFNACGVGDAGGTFLLAYRPTDNPTTVKILKRSGHGSWGEYETVSIGAANAYDRPFIGASATHIVLLLGGTYTLGQAPTTTGGERDFKMYRIDRRLALSDQRFIDGSMGMITGFYGGGRNLIHSAKLRWNGTALVLAGLKYEAIDGEHVPGTFYARVGEAWSKVPIKDEVWEGYVSYADRPVGYQPGNQLFNAIETWAIMGHPTLGYTGFSSPWTSSSSSGGFGSVRGKFLFVDCAAGSHYRLKYNDPTSLASAGDVSWCVGSRTTTTAGCLVCWEVAVESSDAVAAGDLNFLGVRISSRDPFDSTQRAQLHVEINTTSVSVMDESTGTAILTITPDTSTYGSTPFKTAWEFRWSFCPRPSANTKLTMLMCRQIGTTDWLQAGPTTYSTSFVGVSTSYNQFISFGQHGSTTSGSKSMWRSLRVHQLDDLRQATTIGPTSGAGLLRDNSRKMTIRGRECSTFPIALLDLVEVSWGGGGGFHGDTFQSMTAHSYDAANIFLGPQLEYRSDVVDSVSSQHEIVLNAGPNTSSRFVHDAVGVVGTNVETIEFRYSDTTSFSATSGTLDLRRFGPFRIDAVDSGSGFEISGSSSDTMPRDGEVSSSNGRQYFCRVTAVPAGCTSISTNDSFVIEDQRILTSSKHKLVTDGQLFLTAAVGTSVSIYSDRGVFKFTTPQEGRYMRIKLNKQQPSDGYYRMGTFVAGVTFAMDVPLDWEHTDTDAPNLTTFRSRSGVSWAYVEGPPRRTVTGAVTGDADTFRSQFRNLLRSTAQYGDRPFMLCMDELDHTNAETTMLVRAPAGMVFEQTGWRYLEDEGRWVAVGNSSLTFEEDV